MNQDEKIAYDYLVHENYSSIVYEPDGNIPPDFLVNNKIAIEVRRLNQHKLVNGVYKPIEELGFKLIPRIAKTLKELETNDFESSILVTVYYQRPLKVNTKLLNKLKTEIKNKLPLTTKEIKIDIDYNLQLKLYQSKLKFSSSISIGAIHDLDGGGFVVSNIYDNLKLILKEKKRKTLPYHEKYKTWWLILIDYIGYNLDKVDIQQLNSAPRLKTIFNKVLLLSPINNIVNELTVENE